MWQISSCSTTLFPNLTATGSTEFHATTKNLLAFDWKFWSLPSHSSDKSHQTDDGLHTSVPISVSRAGLSSNGYSKASYTPVTVSKAAKVYLRFEPPTKFARWTFILNLKECTYDVKEAWELLPVCITWKLPIKTHNVMLNSTITAFHCSW